MRAKHKIGQLVEYRNGDSTTAFDKIEGVLYRENAVGYVLAKAQAPIAEGAIVAGYYPQKERKAKKTKTATTTTRSSKANGRAAAQEATAAN